MLSLQFVLIDLVDTAIAAVVAKRQKYLQIETAKCIIHVFVRLIRGCSVKTVDYELMV